MTPANTGRPVRKPAVGMRDTGGLDPAGGEVGISWRIRLTGPANEMDAGGRGREELAIVHQGPA